jgi:molecular chaperone HtpG
MATVLYIRASRLLLKEHQVEFKSTLEKRASQASSLEAFNWLNLHGIRAAVAELLNLIGRDGIFREYTRHDITHIDRLLEMLEWIIPPATLLQMTSADCLMTTLAVYLHDLGMLVTRDEFDRREESSFPKFKQEVFEGNDGKDYREKVSKMGSDESERFLYQEFVRKHHAERIRWWVAGKKKPELGVADRVTDEVDKVLGGLDAKFRKDLGLVCESHHLSDLDDLDKYKTDQPYGSGAQQIANLQYCAILLRTADLLHVTRDRAPSISFRVTNPADPKSIEEWNKQIPVISVRPKPALDEDGNVDPDAQTDTVAVDGLFTDPKGFFALTAYLNYARKELRSCKRWAETARRRRSIKYDFPWREIDDSGLEAEGFVNKQFEFTLDQAKILDLLTGRTLYNDTTVAIRELVQNSLDAIRLQREGEPGFISDGQVSIEWDSKNRVLTVRDNGTGMTQRTIDEHFLKVGSSIYQDEEFRKLHPEFSAISRFGIGVLSAFMISDEIEVTTCHPDDEQARTLTLRSLHGKYLIKLSDKTSPNLPKDILKHGTQLTLRVRPSAELKNLDSILRRWIVVPRCNVTVVVDAAAPMSVGFLGPKQALEHEASRLGLLIHQPADASKPKDRSIRIEQHVKGGVSLAYAVQWSETFQEWAFLIFRPDRQLAEPPLIGTCVEGVHVEFTSPGYQEVLLFALANAVGPSAPKTNVARSGIEVTAEQGSLLRTLYELYCEHVKTEVKRIQADGNYSLTWALGEATWLMDSLLPSTFRPGRAHDYDAQLEACAEVPSIALEEKDARVGISSRELANYEFFWTVDSAFFSSGETLLKEISTSAALSRLAASIGDTSFGLPAGPYISVQRPRSVAQRLAFHNREVDRIELRRDQRRVDLRWVNPPNPPLWRNALPQRIDAQRVLTQLLAQSGEAQLGNDLADILIGQGAVQCVGLDGETSIASLGRTLILPGSRYAKYLLKLIDQLDASPDLTRTAVYAIAVGASFLVGHVRNAEDFVKQRLAAISRIPLVGLVSLDADPELIEVLQTTTFKTFSLRAWARGDQPLF